tara:strand:- start:26 stop:427 length:402 start_codon:yes stop_codon:yes gene_type:complete
MATDLIYDIEVSKDKTLIKLNVEIPARVRAKDPIIEFGDKNAVDVLRDKGMLEGYKLSKSHDRLSNWYADNRTGTWVFQREATTTTTAAATTPTVEATSTTTNATATTKAPTNAKKSTSNRKRRKVTTTESTS